MAQVPVPLRWRGDGGTVAETATKQISCPSSASVDAEHSIESAEKRRIAAEQELQSLTVREVAGVAETAHLIQQIEEKSSIIAGLHDRLAEAHMEMQTVFLNCESLEEQIDGANRRGGLLRWPEDKEDSAAGEEERLVRKIFELEEQVRARALLNTQNAGQLAPRPRSIVFPDPRRLREHGVAEVALGPELGVIAFYFPGREEAWDTFCGSSFLGNFYDLGPGGLELEAPCEPGRRCTFRNAEAAFQALKFWQLADEFANLSGEDAFRKKRQLSGQEDLSYGGFGSNWKGMQAVLAAKFKPQTALTDALLCTGDSFLLEHNPVDGRDKVWSDNSDGTGTNWLGLQLLLLRDQRGGGNGDWTRYVAGLIDLESGTAHDLEGSRQWQETVRRAVVALKSQMCLQLGSATHAGQKQAGVALAAEEEPAIVLAECARPVCSRPPLNGKVGEYCSISCRDSSLVEATSVPEPPEEF